MIDPPLTTHSLRQCLTVREAFESMDKFNYVLCSPLNRTMETCLEAFKPLFEERGLKIIAWGDLREWDNSTWNQGSSLNELKRKYEGMPVDLSLIKEGWELIQDKDRKKRQSLSWVVSVNSKNVSYMADGG
jgi:broad specificity phosphatase PhoE